MPTELVLSVAHGYGNGSPSSIANPFYSTNQIVSFHWILKLVGSTVESASYMLNSMIWRAKISSPHLIPM
jgi:hypothetical protein